MVSRARGHATLRAPGRARQAHLTSVPEPRQQQRPEQPFRNAQKIRGAFDSEHGNHPEDERPVSKERNEALCFLIKPLLLSEEEVDDHHRCPDQVIVEVVLEEPHADQRFDKEYPCFRSFLQRAEALASAASVMLCADASDENSVMSPSTNVGWVRIASRSAV